VAGCSLPSALLSGIAEVAGGFLALNVLLALWLVAAPHVSVLHRFIAMIGDNAVAAFCLLKLGEGGAVILFVYFFITFGNGFRYGRIYLHASQLMGLVSFSVLLPCHLSGPSTSGLGLAT
jgi:two-component system sensor histidine kinase RpfC